MPLTFPNVGIQSIEMRLTRAVAVAESPFTYEQQAYDFGGARWEAEIVLPPLSHAEARSVEAFLIGLKGRSGTFTFGHPLHFIDKSILTSGATTINDQTVTASGNAVDAGNYFQLGNYLYIVTEDFSGTGEMSIQPPMREAIPTQTQLDFNKPVSTWRLTANDIGWSTGVSSMYSFTIPCIEAL